jgi:hypothetical protein
VTLAVTVTPDGSENTSADSDDASDDGSDEAAGCSAGRSSGLGWLALTPVLLVLRRRRTRR